MKKIISVLLAILSMLYLSNFALATGAISITSVSIPSSTTQGSTFTITMSISGSTIQNNQASGSLTLPSGLSCTPSGTQTISLSSGGTGSASWSCSASVAGDYSNKITASATATDSGTGGGLSDTAQTGLTVLSPASLTVSSTISSSSISTGSSVTFTVGVNNIGDSATTFSISLSCPSGLSCSPTSVSSTSISGNSLANNQFTVTGSSAGSYTITATVSSPVQSDSTTSKSLTVSSATTTTSAPGGSSGSSGTTAVETGKVTKTFTSITELAPKTITETQLADSKSKLTEIYIAVSTRITDVSITIEKLAGKPNETTDAPNAYEYIKITTVNLVNISQAKIKFKVEKSWISKNNIDVSTITLYRYTTGWDKLKTTKLSEDSNYYYFESEIPGFSNFAIGGEKLKTTTTTTGVGPTGTTTTVPTTTTTSSPAAVTKLPTTYMAIALVIIAFVVLVVFFFKKGS